MLSIVFELLSTQIILICFPDLVHFPFPRSLLPLNVDHSDVLLNILYKRLTPPGAHTRMHHIHSHIPWSTFQTSRPLDSQRSPGLMTEVIPKRCANMCQQGSHTFQWQYCRDAMPFLSFSGVNVWVVVSVCLSMCAISLTPTLHLWFSQHLLKGLQMRKCEVPLYM